jgi:hypothetical protein
VALPLCGRGSNPAILAATPTLAELADTRSGRVRLAEITLSLLDVVASASNVRAARLGVEYAVIATARLAAVANLGNSRKTCEAILTTVVETQERLGRDRETDAATPLFASIWPDRFPRFLLRVAATLTFV